MAPRKKSDRAALTSCRELRAMSPEDLRKALREQRQELMTTRFRHAAAQLERTSDIKSMRRQVARIETLLSEKRTEG